MSLAGCFSLNYPKDGPCTQEQVGHQICSDDCTEILQCFELGASPIPIRNCSLQNTYCTINQTNHQANCTANTPDCAALAADPVKCGHFGEMPHPTKCDTTIYCADNLSIIKRCTCTRGSYIDITRNNLPCVEAAQCPREKVTCNYVGETGTFPGSQDYCFTCWYEPGNGTDANPAQNLIEVYPCPSKLNLKTLFFPVSKVKQCVDVA